ncbi:MAG: PHP domain-containing protein [Clostridia bacterium]
MIDAHVHIFHGNSGEYTIDLINSFVEQAQKNGITEIYMLEHTHQFYEFEQVYKPVADYNEYQKNWLSGKLKASLEAYTDFIDKAKDYNFPIKVKFGLEVCYIPETEHILATLLKQYKWDFVTGSVHYIDNWGFDHKAEFWQGIDVDEAYSRYYETMHQLIMSNLFSGVAHPDSIKCFGHYPSKDLSSTYAALAEALNKAGMYAEQSGGLALNYGFPELGMNSSMLEIFKANNVRILTASDAHRSEHAGANIKELQRILNA